MDIPPVLRSDVCAGRNVAQPSRLCASPAQPRRLCYEGSRRQFLVAALAGLVGCGRPSDNVPIVIPKDSTFEERVSDARERGINFLLSRQDEDGAWRSDTYGTFKDGTALTPLALHALLTAAPESQKPIERAAAHLAAMARPDGDIARPSYGFDFALYTAALTVISLNHPSCPEHVAARLAWLRFLRERQLTEDLGWKPEDREFGGWGYARGLPRKPKAGELIPPLTESNLSATTFALDALRAAGVPPHDHAYAKALSFVRRCQNWTDDPARRDPVFDDGGFFFIYDDPVRNKAGVAGKDATGQDRFRSYGSATADGLRCLTHCGVPDGDPSRVAARSWLVSHFRAAWHPGAYAERREMDRMAVYYYYSASLAKITPALVVETDDGPVAVKRIIAEDLLNRQRDDGSWANPVHATREDEANIATAFAVVALG
jgi:Prenyltransferase and squalene oxidase repeat